MYTDLKYPATISLITSSVQQCYHSIFDPSTEQHWEVTLIITWQFQCMYQFQSFHSVTLGQLIFASTAE